MRRNGKGGKPLDYAQIGDDDPLLPVAAKAASSSSAVNIFSVVQSLIVISLVAVAVVGGVYTSIGFNILNDHERRITYFEGDPRFLQITSELDRVKLNVTNLQLISNSSIITLLIDSLNGKTMGLMSNLTDFEAWFSQEVLWRIGNDTQISTNVTILQTQIGLLSNSTDFVAKLDGLMMNISSVQQEIAASNVTMIAADLAAEVAARMAEDAQIVSDLAAEAAARIANDTATMAMFQQTVKSVNNLPPLSNNIDIVPGNSGINVTNTGSTVSIWNNGILNLNGQSPDGAGTFLLNGASGVGVTSGPLSYQITIDGSVIETAVNNLDMTVAGQAAQLLNQTSINTDLYDLISNLALSGNMVAQMLNGTTLSVNETIMELITRIQAVELENALLAAQLANLTSANEVIGVIKAWAGASNMVPAGYLLCDGTVLSQTTYPVLYAAIGCAYCPAFTCGVGTFCLPDLQGRVPVGQKVADTNFGLRGQQSGAATHTLLSTEMPSHTHSATDNGHAHNLLLRIPLSLYPKTSPGGIFNVIPGNVVTCPASAFNDGSYSYYAESINAYPSASDDTSGGNCFNGYGNTLFRHSYTTDTGYSSISVGSAGSGAAHNNVQPSLTVGGWIIRVDA